MSKTLPVLGRGRSGLLLNFPGEVVLIFKPRLVGDFSGGQSGGPQQPHCLFHSPFPQVLHGGEVSRFFEQPHQVFSRDAGCFRDSG